MASAFVRGDVEGVSVYNPALEMHVTLKHGVEYDPESEFVKANAWAFVIREDVVETSVEDAAARTAGVEDASATPGTRRTR